LLEHELAFPMVLLLMAAVATGLFALFRNRDWL
jgi:hypothetical protein